MKGTSPKYQELIFALASNGEAAVDDRTQLDPAELAMFEKTMESRRQAFIKSSYDEHETELKIQHGSHGVKEVAPELYAYGSDVVDSIEQAQPEKEAQHDTTEAAGTEDPGTPG